MSLAEQVIDQGIDMEPLSITAINRVANELAQNLPPDRQMEIAAAVPVAEALIRKLEINDDCFELSMAVNWERSILLLGIAQQWEAADLAQRKQLLRQLSLLFDRHERQRPIPYHYPQDSSDTDQFAGTLLYVYCFFDECKRFFPELSRYENPSFEDVLEVVSEYSFEERMETTDKLYDWLFAFKAELVQFDGKTVKAVHLPFSHQYGNAGSNQVLSLIHQALNTPDEYRSYPLAYAVGYNESQVVFGKKSSMRRTRIHEFNHATQPNLFSNLGVGLNEGVTEWRSQRRVAKTNPLLAVGLAIENKLKQKKYFGTKTQKLMAEVYLGMVPNISFKPIHGESLHYNEEVSFVEKLFAQDPVLQQLILDRYESDAPELGIVLARHIISKYGLEGYQDLLLMDPDARKLDEANANQVGYLTPQAVAQKYFVDKPVLNWNQFIDWIMTWGAELSKTKLYGSSG